MKKIIFFNSSMEMGGPPKIISMWGNYFAKKKFKIKIVSNIKKKSFYKLNKKIKLEYLNIEKFKQKKILSTFLKLKNFLIKEKNSVIIFNKSGYITYLFFLKYFGFVNKNIKLIYFAHSGSADFKTIYNNLQNMFIYLTFDNLIVNHNDYYSDSSIKKFKKKIKHKIINFFIPFNWEKFKKKIIYIPNSYGEYPSKFSKLKSKTILCAGRLVKEKGFDRAIKLFKKIDYKENKIKIYILGDGPEKHNLHELIKNLKLQKYVKIITGKKDLRTYYLNSSIFFLPSLNNESGWREGMPMVLLDAIKFGLPIVSSKIPGINSMVKNNFNGYTYSNINNKKLFTKFNSLLANYYLRKKMGEYSKKISRNFEIEKISLLWKRVLI